MAVCPIVISAAFAAVVVRNGWRGSHQVLAAQFHYICYLHGGQGEHCREVGVTAEVLEVSLYDQGGEPDCRGYGDEQCLMFVAQHHQFSLN